MNISVTGKIFSANKGLQQNPFMKPGNNNLMPMEQPADHLNIDADYVSFKGRGSSKINWFAKTIKGKMQSFFNKFKKEGNTFKNSLQKYIVKIKNPIDMDAKELTGRELSKIVRKSHKAPGIRTFASSVLGSLVGTSVALAGGATVLVKLFEQTLFAKSLTVLSAVEAPFIALFTGLKFLGTGLFSLAKLPITLIGSL